MYILHLPHDPVTTLIAFGNIHDIVAHHKLIRMSELVRIVSSFRKQLPIEWVERIVRLCPHTFRYERDYVWLAHACPNCPETCAYCRRASDEVQVLVASFVQQQSFNPRV